MKPTMALGDFLVAYLRKIGVTHLFGIPGDLVLRLFLRFGARRGLRVVTLSHEPGVGFAADGYARATGRIGVVCVTYGAGGHNMVNPVAGSFSERVPLLVLSGGPGDEERKLGTLIHHQAKEIESQLRIYRELTCAARLLDDVRTAAETVHELVQTVWREQRPGYLEVHRDMVERRIPVPKEILAWDGALQFARSDEQNVAEAVRDTAARFNASRRPLVTVGIETFRYKLKRDVQRLAETMGAPVATTVLSRGLPGHALPRRHIGAIRAGISVASTAPTRAQSGGEHRHDLGSGPAVRSLDLGVEGRVHVSFHTYTDVHIRDFVRGCCGPAGAIATRALPRQSAAQSARPAALRVTALLHEVNRFLVDHPRHLVVTESGDMLFAGLDVRIGRRGGYLAQGFYASMGFGVPGALGAQLGSGVRPLVLAGDGAFQMTGPEISHAPRYGIDPIVVVVNNGGWQIFRPVVSRTALLDLPAWPYAELARAWGGMGVRVETAAALRRALADAARCKSFVVIEACVRPDDHSPVARKYIEASSRHGQRGRR
jgi:indolepyruvate decarboxylase